MEMDVRVIRAGGPGLKSFLSLAVASWRSALGRNLTGVYVHGSVSTGAFNPRTSDIDVRRDHPDADRRTGERAHPRGPRAMHGWGTARWADRLEAMFVPAKRARDGRRPPDLASWSCIPMKGFKVQPLGPDFMIQKRSLREHGITLYGPRIAKIVAPVTNGELRDAVIGNLRGWWLPQLEYPGQFLQRSYQAYARAHDVPLAVPAGDRRARDQARGSRLGAARSVPRAWRPLIQSARGVSGGPAAGPASWRPSSSSDSPSRRPESVTRRQAPDNKEHGGPPPLHSPAHRPA